MSLGLGVKAISKYILNKGIKKAVSKFGKEAVDKAKSSNAFKDMVNNPPMSTGQKAVVGGSAGIATAGTAATGYGYKKAYDKLEEIKEKKEPVKKANGGMVRGHGKAIRGTKFKGVF